MKQKLYAEFIGTFILIFCGTGSMVINEATGGAIGNTGIALTWGLIVMALIYTFGGISGCHINPAVTMALAVQKKFSRKHVAPYLVAQVCGAVVASLVLRFLFPDAITLGETLPKGSELQSFVLEFLLTFFLMTTIIYSTKEEETKYFAPLAIGGVVGLEACFAGPICGASMNPARSLAPALVNLNFEHLWVYLVATILGALFAVFLDRVFGGEDSLSSDF